MRKPGGGVMAVLLAMWTLGAQTNRAATLIWDPDGVFVAPLGGSGVWDTTTPLWDNAGTYQTWSNVVANIAQFGGDPGTVTLGEPITAQGLSFKSDYKLVSGAPANTLTLTGGTIRADLGTFSVIDSKISGAAGLTKSGGGTVRLTNAGNDYAGTTTIDGGILSIGNMAALGADVSAVAINGSAARGFGGGALLLEGSYSSGITFSRGLTLQGAGPTPASGAALLSVGNNTITGLVTNGAALVNTAVSSAGGRLTLGDVTLGGAAGTVFMSFGTANSLGAGSYAITGVLASAAASQGTIGKTGAGTLFLTPSSATGYSGIFQVSAGSIRVTDTAALGTSAATNAIDLNGGLFELRTDTPTFASAKRINLNNGSGATDLLLDRTPGGTGLNQTVTFANFDYDAAETMAINTRNGYGATFTAATAVGAGVGDTTLTNNGNGLVTYGGTLWGNTDTTVRILTVNGTGNTVISGNITASGALHTLVKSGTGTATILGTGSTYTGATTISGGALVITDFRTLNGHNTGTNTAAVNIGSGTTAGILTIGTATAATAAGLTLLTGKAVNLNGTTGGGTINASQSVTLPVIIGSVTATGAGAKSLTLGGTSAVAVENLISGAIPDSSSATSLVKTDANLWALSGTNTYTGSTTISGGTLRLKANAATTSTIIGEAAGNTVVFNTNAATATAGGTLELLGFSGSATTETLGALTPTAGAGTVRLTANSISPSATSLVFTSLGATAGASSVNFITTAASGGGVTLNGQAATTATTLPGTANFQGHLYINGADFAAIDGAANVITPVYGATLGFVTAPSSLVATSHNLLTGSFTNAAATISSLKATTQTLTLSGNLTVSLGAILQSGGTATIQSSSTAARTIVGGAAGVNIAIRVDGAGDVLNLGAPNAPVNIASTTTAGLTKNGAGTLVINGVNAQTGTTTINEGTIRLGANSARLSGANAALVIRQGATLDLNGQSSGTAIGAFDGSGTVTNSSATAATLLLGGTGTGAGTFAGIIQDGAGVVNVSLNGTTGTPTWSGLNTYTGVTTIGTGLATTAKLVNVPTLANYGTASSIGRGIQTVVSDANNAASLVLAGLSTAGIAYTGTTSVSIDRLFTLGGNFAGAGGQIANNSGNSSTLILNKTNAISFAAGLTFEQTLTLGGSSTGDNQINLQIADNGSLATHVNKIGAGLWVLGNAANSYTGLTQIGVTTSAGGVLQAVDGATLPSTSPLVLGGTTGGGVFQTSGSFTRNITVTPVNGTGTVTFNSTLTSGGAGFAASDGKLVVALGGLATPAALTWGSGGFMGVNGTSTGAFVLSSSTALSEVEVRNAIDLNGASRTIQVDDNSNTFADFATITGVISGTGSLTKTGTGTLQLFAANTYSGVTAVTSASTLTVNSLGDSAAPGLGTSLGTSTNANLASNALTLGNAGTTGGILQYVGPGETSDRMIRLNTTTGTTQIHADGAGPLVLTNVVNDMAVGNKTLSLRGANPEGNMITSVLADNAPGTNTLGIAVDGAATWILTAANTYSGATDLTGGALGAGNDSAFGTGTLRVRNGSLFAYGADRTITNPLADTSTTTAITSAFIGDYSLNLTGAWTHTNTTAGQTITNGIVTGKTLTLGGDLSFNAITGARTVTVNGPGDTIINGSFTTSTAFNINLTYSGTGSLTLGGTASQLGNVTLSNGTLKLGASNVITDGAAAGNLTISPAVGVTATLDLNGQNETINGLTGASAGTMIITNSSASAASLTVGGNNQTVSFAGGITRNGPLTLGKTGTAIATFTGPADITGINVGAGTLKLNDPLGMSGAVAAGITSVTVDAGGILNLYDGFGVPLTGITSLALGGGALAGTAQTILELEAGGTGGLGVTAGIDALVTPNAVVVNAATLAGQIVLNVRDAGLSPSTSYTLISAPAGGLLNGGAVNYYALGALGGYAGSTITQTDTSVILNVGTAVLGSMYWTGGTDAKWNTIDGSFNGLNWSPAKDGLTLSTTVPGAGTTVVFQADSAPGAPAGQFRATTLEQSFRIDHLIVESSTNTLNSLSIGPGAVSTNRLTIQPALATDGIKITTPVVKGMLISAQVGAGSNQTWDMADFTPVALTGGATDFTPTPLPTVTVASTAGLVPGMQISGPGIPTGAYIVSVDSATQFTMSANTTGENAALQNYTATSALTLSGGLTGSGSITKTGAGRVVLSGAGNTYTGASVTVGGGILETQNVTALGGVAATPNTGATITIGPGAEFRHNAAASGTIANPLVLNGGTLSSGGFTSNATTLALTAVNHTYSGAVSVTGDSTVHLADLATSATLNHTITLSGAITGTGRITVDAAPSLSAGNNIGGTLTINNGTGAWNGPLTVNRGTVVFTNVAGSGNATPYVAYDGTVDFSAFGRIIYRNIDGGVLNRSSTINFAAGAVGELQVDNVGALASNFTVNQNGVVNLNAGSIVRLTLADAASHLNFGGGVVLNGNASITAIGGDADSLVSFNTTGISGTGNLAINDEAGVWAQTSTRIAINAAGTFSGNTSLNEGTLIVGHKDALSTGSFTVTGTSTLQPGVDLSGANAFPNATTLSASLTVSGANSLTFANAVTQSGGDRTLTNSLASPSALMMTTVRLAETGAAAARNLTLAGAGIASIGTLVNNDQSNTLTNNLTSPSLAIGTIALSETAAAGRTLTLGGTGNTVVAGLIENIAGGGGQPGALNKTGTGILTLQGANTFTGDVTATAGTIEFSTVTDAGGAASNLGQGANLNLAGATLNFIGSVSQSTNRPTPLTASSTLAANGTGGATITYNGVMNGGATSLTLDGSGAGIFNGVLTQTGTGNDINKNGSGTWTLGATNLIADDINVNAGVLNINAPQNFLNTATTASNHLVVTGTTAVVNLNAANSFLGDDLFIRSGSVVNLGINGALARESAARGTDGMRNMLIGDSGTTDLSTLDLKGFTAATGTITIGTDTIPGQIIDSVGGGSINSTGVTVRLGNASGSISGTATFAKNGGGLFTLSGSNTFTGATTVAEGTLLLDYSTNNSSKIAAAAGVTIGGTSADVNPTLTINGNASAATTQAFTTLTLSQASSNIVVASNGGQAANLNFTTFTRNAGATLDITLPAVGAVTTTQALVNGMLGGYLTLGNGASFATKDGSNAIQPLAPTTKADVTTWTLADNVTDGGGGFTGAVTGVTAVNSITYSGVAAAANSTGVIGVNSGGILVTSPSTGSSLNGGTITSGLSDVVVHQYAAGDFTLGAAMRGINALTKTGSGALVLSGTSTSNGAVNITEGLVTVTGGKAIGDTAAVGFKDAAGVGLQLLSNETVGNISGGGAAGGNIALGNNTLTTNVTASTTFAGLFTGGATSAIVRNGTSGVGNLLFTGASGAGFTGTVTINGGLLYLEGLGSLNASSITLNKGASFLISNNGTTRTATRLLDTATIVLNSADGSWSGETRPSGLAVRTDQAATTSETIGVLAFASGASYFRGDASGTTGVAGILTSNFVRTNNATLDARGRALGGSSGDRNQLRIADTANQTTFIATLLGGGGAAGSKNISIVPWAFGETTSGGLADANMGNSLVTYVSGTGIRPLDLATEYNTFSGSPSVSDNIRESLAADLTGLAGSTINALVINNSNTAAGTVAVTGTGAGQALAVTSGTMLFTAAAAITGTPVMGISLGGFDGGITVGTTGEYVIFVQNPTSAAAGGTVTATISSPLTSTADITKSGRGVFVLSGTNTAGGGGRKTTLNEGVLEIAGLANIGGASGGLVFAGGTLRLGTTLTDDISTRNISFLQGGGTIDTNGVNLTLANSIGAGSAGSFTKTGAGNLTLNAAMTHTGGTTVTNGTLVAGVANFVPASSSLTVNGATAALDIGAFNQTAGTFTLVNGALNGSATLTAADYQLQAGAIAPTVVLAGSSGVTKTTAGAVVVGGGNTFTGIVAVQGGTLSFDSIANIGAGASALGAPTTAVNGAIQMGLGTAATALTYTGAGSTTDRTIALVGTTGAATINANGTGALAIGAVTSMEFGAKSLILRGTSAGGVANKITGAVTESLGTLTVQKLDANVWQLDAPSTYTGATQIDDGTLRIGASNVLPAATAVRLGSGTTAGALDLNGFNQTIGSLTSLTNSTTATNQINVTAGNTLTINGAVTLGVNAATSTTLVTASGGGDVVVNNSGGVFQVGGATGSTNANSATADFSGLANFTANLGATGTFRVGDVTTGTTVAPSTMKLATNNTITGGSIRIGDSSGPSSVDTLTLGSGTNTLNADLINIGSAGSGIRSSGLVNFAPADTTGTVKIRGSDGTSAATLNMVNTTGSTGGNIDSTINLAGHTADLKFTAVTMASRTTNTGAASATLTFDQGTMDITTLALASRTGGGTGNASAVVNLGDSAAPGSPTTTIGSMTMAVNTSASGTVSADFNVTGGGVTIGAINMANAGAGRAVTSSIALTGGSTTVTGNITRTGGAGTESATVTVDGGTLDMTGKNIGTGTASVALVAASGTLKNLGELNGGGAFTKTTAGTLTLEGANTHTGNTTVSAGTLVVNNASGSGTGSGSVTVDLGATLAGNGAIAPASGRSITLNGSAVIGTPGSSSAEDFVMTVAGAAGIALNGTMRIDLFSNANTGTTNGPAANDLLAVNAADWSALLFGGASTLKIDSTLPANGYAQGDGWKIFDWSGILAGTPPSVGSGGFASLDLPVLDAGYTWNTSQLYTQGVISIDVVPEPGRALLALLGLLALAFRRRRKV